MKLMASARCRTVYFIRLSVSILILSAAPFPSKAEQNTLNIGFDVAVPWKYIDRNGNLEGPEVTMLKTIAERMNLKPKFEVVPFKRGLLHLQHGQLDIMSGLLKRPEREQYISFLVPPYKTKSHKAFYTLKESGVTITKYEDLQGVTIGVKIGYRYFPKFDRDQTLSRYAVSSEKQLVKMLLAKRIPVILILETRGDFLIKQLDENQRIQKAPFGFYQDSPVYLGLSKKSPLIKRLAEFERIVGQMVENGEIDMIFTSFFIHKNLPVPVYK